MCIYRSISLVLSGVCLKTAYDFYNITDDKNNFIIYLVATILFLVIGLFNKKNKHTVADNFINEDQIVSKDDLPVKIDQETDDHIRGLLRNGQKIEAIKFLREKTGVGLKEAKEYIESL